MNTWKPEVKVAGNGEKWSQNGLVFATRHEALQSARALMDRWLLVVDCRAVPSDHPVKYSIVNNELVFIGEKSEI